MTVLPLLRGRRILVTARAAAGLSAALGRARAFAGLSRLRLRLLFALRILLGPSGAALNVRIAVPAVVLLGAETIMVSGGVTLALPSSEPTIRLTIGVPSPVT